MREERRKKRGQLHQLGCLDRVLLSSGIWSVKLARRVGLEVRYIRVADIPRLRT